MFQNLLNFRHQKTIQEAVIFYIIALLAGMFIGAAAGAGGALVLENFSTEIATKFGLYSSILYTAILVFMVLKVKQLYRYSFYISLAIVSLVVSFFFSAIGSLVIIAYLTTRPNYE